MHRDAGVWRTVTPDTLSNRKIVSETGCRLVLVNVD